MVVLTAASFLFFFILGFFAVNVAIVVSSRTSAQRAADAAALAGCLSLRATLLASDNPITVATQYVESADRNNTGGATSLHIEGRNQAIPAPVVSTTGTTGANGVLANNKITVNVRRSQRLFGLPSVDVTAHASCIREEGGLPVLQSLSTAKASFTIEQAQIDLGKGGIIVGAQACPNGDAKTMSVNGGATITARWIDLCTGGQPFLSASSWINPPATPGWLADPFADVLEPQLGGSIDIEPGSLPPRPTGAAVNNPEPMPGCTYANPGFTTARNPVACEVHAGGTLQPGVYYGGIVLDGQGSSTPITLSAGLYYLAGGGLSIGVNTVVHGPGVIVFNTRDLDAQNSPRRVCGPITVQDGVHFLVTPPTAGEYKDLVIFQARYAAGLPDCSAPTKIQSGVTMGFPDPPFGAIYLPNSTIYIGPQSLGQSGALDAINMRVVAYEIDLTGPVTFADIFIPSGDVNHGDVRLSE